MVLWQYTFHVLPMEGVETLSSDYHFEKNECGFDDEPYWKLNAIRRDFFVVIQEIMPKSKSWSDHIDLYGIQESNCFEVLSDNEGDVISVSFRVDFRAKYEKVLNQIIEFCCLSGLVILDEGLNIVHNNYEHIQKIIEDSLQAKKYSELSEKDKNV